MEDHARRYIIVWGFVALLQNTVAAGLLLTRCIKDLTLETCQALWMWMWMYTHPIDQVDLCRSPCRWRDYNCEIITALRGLPSNE